MIAKDSVERFVAYWLAQNGSERSLCHQFWDSLLGEVLGVTDLKRFIEYEKPVYIKRNDTTLKGYGKSLYNMALVRVAAQTAYVL